MFILSKIKTYAAIAGAFIIALAYAFFRGRASGVDSAEQRSKDAILDDVKTAKEVKDEVEIMDDVGLANRASKWLRNNDE